MKYTLTLFMDRYMQIGEEWQIVEVKRTFAFKDYDDVQNLVGYLVAGANGSVKFEVEEAKEEA